MLKTILTETNHIHPSKLAGLIREAVDEFIVVPVFSSSDILRLELWEKHFDKNNKEHEKFTVLSKMLVSNRVSSDNKRFTNVCIVRNDYTQSFWTDIAESAELYYFLDKRAVLWNPNVD